MKRVILFTIILGLTLLLVCIYISVQKPVRMLKYSDGNLEEISGK
jgi:hypothetical protein